MKKSCAVLLLTVVLTFLVFPGFLGAPQGNLAPGPFGPLRDLAPPTSGTTTTKRTTTTTTKRSADEDNNVQVFVPPDIKYWAYGKVNTTIVDGGGLPWYCYTYRQTHCRPLFKLPANWRTTRRPIRKGGPTPRGSYPRARSTTTAPPDPYPGARSSTTPPPVTIIRTTFSDSDNLLDSDQIRITNRGQTLRGRTGGPTPRPTGPPTSKGYGYTMTTPDTTEVYSFFGTGSSGLQMLNTSSLYTPPDPNPYSTVVVHSPSPRPPVVHPVGPPLRPPPPVPPTSVVYTSVTHSVQSGPISSSSGSGSGSGSRQTTTPSSVVRTTRFAHFPKISTTQRPNQKFTDTFAQATTPLPTGPPRPNNKFTQEFRPQKVTTTTPVAEPRNIDDKSCISCVPAKQVFDKDKEDHGVENETNEIDLDRETNTLRTTSSLRTPTDVSGIPWPFFDPTAPYIPGTRPRITFTTPRPSTRRTTRTTRLTTTRPRRRSTTTESSSDRRGSVRAIEVTNIPPSTFFKRRNGTTIDAIIETQATLTLNYSLEVTPPPGTTTPTTSFNTSTTATPSNDVELAPAFTVFGEACRDACTSRGYPYTWCTKRRLSTIGTWSDTGHCTATSNITSTGEGCIDDCLRRGQQYYWCHKESTLWGFCTPQFLIERTGRFAGVVNETKVAPPQAYTVRGEACKDGCDRRGYSYTWCHKTVPSSLGTWRSSDYCSNEPNVTSDGKACVNSCAFRGYSYAWCNTQDSWGYCTPKSFLNFLSRLHSNAGPSSPFEKDANVNFDNLDSNRLLVDEGPASVRPYTTSTTSTTTTTTITTPPRTAYVVSNPDPVFKKPGDPGYVDDYPDEEEGGDDGNAAGGLNDEISAATDLNSVRFPKYYRRAVGFTVFGESCYDECEQRDGYGYTWCHKFKESKIGTWRNADFCTKDSKTTPHGDECIDECLQRGQAYFWCHKATTLWGYCTPEHLIKQLEQNKLSRELLLLSIFK